MYSWFVRNISFPIIAKRNGLPRLMKYLNQLEESQYWPRERLVELQFERLKALLIHAYVNTAFYKSRFDEAGFDPFDFSDLNETTKIPVLTKNHIRDNLESLISKNYSQADLHSSETGGTTGVKMKFYRDNACLSPKEAGLYRFEKWTGWNFGERMGLVWTAQQDYVGYWTKRARIKNELFGRQVVFPAAIIDEASIATYVKDLMIKKPTMIRAFTSPIFEVAKYIKNNAIGNSTVKGVITTGEPLYGHQREIISEAFDCDVFDSYRSREAGPLAQECEAHNGMHINAESLFIESVPPKDPQHFAYVQRGSGDLVVTDLLNYGMPLIRYKMDDMGSLSDEVCPCGRGLPLLKNLAGRTADIFYSPDKKRITAGSLVLYLVDQAPGHLGQIQIIQDRLDHLVIKMTSDPLPSDEIRSYQAGKVKELFGPNMKVSFEIVDNIAREKSGKYLFTKCLINENKTS
jgi:phenylacetate-CoA ligase